MFNFLTLVALSLAFAVPNSCPAPEDPGWTAEGFVVKRWAYSGTDLYLIVSFEGQHCNMAVGEIMYKHVPIGRFSKFWSDGVCPEPPITCTWDGFRHGITPASWVWTPYIPYLENRNPD